ncbi:MAG: hypothetical protein SFU99_22965 [Saprospiraceae bacterium]|nr:hypothetical protein [Saprospiraceae bacterium]
MKQIFSIALILLWFSACKSDSKSSEATSSSEEKDFLIVPGARIGLITGSTTEAEVEKAYGEDNIEIKSLDVAEGEQREGVLVFPNTKNELEIIWELEADIGKPAFIRLGKENSDWRTAEGIGVGTTLEKLEELNGRPFTFYGFEWDYGGLVSDWNGGNISPYLIIALIPQNFDKLSSDLLGEVQLSSDDPKVRALGAKVGSIVLTFE